MSCEMWDASLENLKMGLRRRSATGKGDGVMRLWRMRDEGWRMRDEGWGMRDEGWRMKDEGWRMRDEGWGMRDEGLGEIVKLWNRKIEMLSFMKRFFTILGFFQNDRVLACSHGLEVCAIGGWGMRFEMRDWKMDWWENGVSVVMKWWGYG